MNNKETTPKVAVQTPEDRPIKELVDTYRGNLIANHKIEDELFNKHGFTSEQLPKLPKVVKLKTGLVTDEVIEQVKALMGGKDPMNATQFNNVLGRAGVTGTADTTAARKELETLGIIKVTEIGTGKGKGSAKSITLVPEASK